MNLPLNQRFRGFLPVVVDVESAGFEAHRHALLEIAAIVITHADGQWQLGPRHHFHVEPFAGAELDPAALAFNGIDPYQPLRGALPEAEVFGTLYPALRKAVKEAHCRRAVLVGHNAHFDLSFLHAAEKRLRLKNSPFHPFSVIDTVSLAALALAETVLAKAVQKAGLAWDGREAHSALYDAERTAELFCWIVNRYDRLEDDAGAALSTSIC
ncbi:MAG: ribonuclease T [Acidithiobacillus caldus]|nr:ribonuclease T [Acidithiobacillus caldus]